MQGLRPEPLAQQLVAGTESHSPRQTGNLSRRVLSFLVRALARADENALASPVGGAACFSSESEETSRPPIRESNFWVCSGAAIYGDEHGQ